MPLMNTRTFTVKICSYYLQSIQNKLLIENLKMTYLQKCFQSTKYEDIKSIVVCGPSGSGKTTLLEKAILHFNDKLKFSVSRMNIFLFYCYF